MVLGGRGFVIWWLLSGTGDESVEIVGEFGLRSLEEVAVDVHRHTDLGVAHALADCFGVRSKFDEQ